MPQAEASGAELQGRCGVAQAVSSSTMLTVAASAAVAHGQRSRTARR